MHWLLYDNAKQLLTFGWEYHLNLYSFINQKTYSWIFTLCITIKKWIAKYRIKCSNKWSVYDFKKTMNFQAH